MMMSDVRETKLINSDGVSARDSEEVQDLSHFVPEHTKQISSCLILNNLHGYGIEVERST